MNRFALLGKARKTDADSSKTRRTPQTGGVLGPPPKEQRAPLAASQRASASFALVLATWFGCGYFPWGPGTAGSLAAVLIAFALHVYGGAGRFVFLALTIVWLAPALWASTRAARITGKKDPGLVVIDEVLGQWLTLIGATAYTWKNFLAAFLLFRFFDIWKPWPIRKIERLPEGYGIVCDDLAAGLYGALILYIGGLFRIS